MGLYVTTKSQATRRGIFALERTPPAVIKPTGFGTAVLVEQLPWGPSQSLKFYDNMGETLKRVAPLGMTRTGSGVLALIRKGFPRLGIVRVLGPTAATAQAIINKTGPAALITVALKNPGTEGNAVVATAAAATDGDSNHFDLIVSVTNAAGTTTDRVFNINVSGVGADALPNQTTIDQLTLIGSITKNSSGVPILGSTTCTGGTDGTITSAEYVGTQGSNDKGVAKLEGSKAIDHFFAGDPGNSLRAAVNAGFKSHADYMSDRVAYITGNSGQTAAAAQSDVANYRSQRVVYLDPWVYILDDTDGTKRLTPGASFAGSVASQLSPSTAISWKNDEVIAMLGGINDLEAERAESAGVNTAAGIATFIREEDGGFTIEGDVTTIAPTTPAKQDLTRTRMGHYAARSTTKSLRPMSDAPNVPANQEDVLDAVIGFMETMKANASNDPNHTPHVIDYAIPDVDANNPQAELDAGDFTVPVDMKLSTGMKRIFLSYQYGSNVVIAS